MKKFISLLLIATLLITGGTMVSANSLKTFSVKQVDFESSTMVEDVNPDALPAVAAAGFVAGVAYKLGTKATGWAWDKVAGRWPPKEKEITSEYIEELEIIFD
ncbi:hypothetical protein [Fervidibacillus albus]|uniref:Uncharacterized protein n=1 Tax=Fervidibacillus albus TaxID=2980026 RepID=A0A9E8LSJ5_9BACI|nr:hypothetical protein [Fervidibacillus albus]WAA08798.1 hypothetical protein OE104_09245 [Fervidibacillus albus]